jgi:RNA recognition motif-containing protein
VNNIYVGNLDLDTTKQLVRSLFEPYGTVAHTKLMTDRDTGCSRGFAFVEMSDAGQAGKAIAALNGTDWRGRALDVKEARPKLHRAGASGERAKPVSLARPAQTQPVVPPVNLETGFVAQYYGLTLRVRLRAGKWNVVVLGPSGLVINHDVHYASQAEARQVAVSLAQKNLHQEKHDNRPPLEAVDWQPA